MAAQVVKLHQARADELEDRIREAVSMSYPLFTYPEFKKIVACEYHRLVASLRETRTWGEISLHTGMTRAGLNKLGDVVPPRSHHSVIRTALRIVHEAGDEGLTLSQLAGAFYAACPELDDGPSLKEAVTALVESGELKVDAGRYIAEPVTRVDDPTLATPIEDTVHHIAESVREDAGEGDAQMDRLSVRIPHGRAKAVMLTLREALIVAATDVEETVTDEEEWLTVVLAGAPGMK